MPRVRVETQRRASLTAAAIAEIAEAGSLDVTVARIARRAGVSSALAHHYFGTKDAIFLAAMRQILTVYGREVRVALAGVRTPRQRLEAVVSASFAPSNFDRAAISAWLIFYVRALTSKPTARLLTVYRRRLRSNLLAGLRPLAGAGAEAAAESVAAMIDGVYVRAGLSADALDPATAKALVIDHIDRLLRGRDPGPPTAHAGA